MKCRLALPLSLLGTFLFTALCTGGVLFYMLALLVALTVLSGLCGMLWAASTLKLTGRLSETTVRRGEDVTLQLSVRHSGRLPIAPILLILSSPGAADREIRIRDLPGRLQTLHMNMHASHVGCFTAGVTACIAEDLLGIFRRSVPVPDSHFELLVLPDTFPTDPIELAPGDPGSDIMARAMEDLSSPSDVRSYQPGDEMKKIHWKLSLRKQELLVRRFEEPILQDVLILLDCSRPPSWGHPEAEADLRDSLLETAASFFTDQCRTDHSVRMPLTGHHPVDLEKNMGIAIAMENLARMDFSATDRFERILAMESRRLMKVGAVVIITARLTGAMVDIIIRMKRMGPTLRLYLSTFAPQDARFRPLLNRLHHASVEVFIISPSPD